MDEGLHLMVTYLLKLLETQALVNEQLLNHIKGIAGEREDFRKQFSTSMGRLSNLYWTTYQRKQYQPQTKSNRKPLNRYTPKYDITATLEFTLSIQDFIFSWARVHPSM